MSALSEKALLGFAVTAALALPAFGVWLSWRTADLHWLNRAGAAVVCVESLVALVEYMRRSRLHRLAEEYPQNPFVIAEAARAERQVITIALGMAVFGELLHGFGDLLMKVAFRLTV